MDAPYTRLLKPNLQKKIRDNINSREEANLRKEAAKSKDGLRRKKDDKPDDIRANFSRDADRILHTHAFSRYIDKTQVFSLFDNDHITHRVLHVQMVSKIGRTIARGLALNEDLIEAIAIGHDIGHTPYGHAGEEVLSRLCEKREIGKFKHNVESVVFLDRIEPKNLTLQVLDGILCHNGEKMHNVLKAEPDKDWAVFDDEMSKITYDGLDPSPKTLEGCIVRYADVISYLGRDIEDACELKLIDIDEIPEECASGIGVRNNDIINSLVIDIIESSRPGNLEIGFSSEMFKKVSRYKQFNDDRIYNNPKVTKEHDKIGEIFNFLFKAFEEDLRKKRKRSRIYKDFCNVDWMKRSEYFKTTKPAEQVRDFIAGMTDHYFLEVYREKVWPERKKYN